MREEKAPEWVKYDISSTNRVCNFGNNAHLHGDSRYEHSDNDGSVRQVETGGNFGMTCSVRS